ncbi:SCO6880 family protein [Bifidobacterium psychraerophilum]|uniref:SCO6880 family protein n=2 Tax=Bifidobacterium psychraerophilum TaxID=218140 RepID=UPI001930B777|nr:SCO6880 family protein [Bifidobacterium psychraerophilum]
MEWLPVDSWWLWRSTGGQLLYRRRIVQPRPEGTLALSGDMAQLCEYTDSDTGACMVHDSHGQTLTAILEVSHPAFILLDPGEQERRVTNWGRVLAAACRSARIVTLQILERTLPGSGTGLAEWWDQHGTHEDFWASTTYEELIERASPAGLRWSPIRGCENPQTAMIRATGLAEGNGLSSGGVDSGDFLEGKTRTALQALLHATGRASRPCPYCSPCRRRRTGGTSTKHQRSGTRPSSRSSSAGRPAPATSRTSPA